MKNMCVRLFVIFLIAVSFGVAAEGWTQYRNLSQDLRRTRAKILSGDATDDDLRLVCGRPFFVRKMLILLQKHRLSLYRAP